MINVGAIAHITLVKPTALKRILNRFPYKTSIRFSDNISLKEDFKNWWSLLAISRKYHALLYKTTEPAETSGIKRIKQRRRETVILQDLLFCSWK